MRLGESGRCRVRREALDETVSGRRPAAPHVRVALRQLARPVLLLVLSFESPTGAQWAEAYVDALQELAPRSGSASSTDG